MNFKIITFGCKVNIYESEIIKENFIKKGYIVNNQNPDIIIINTCSVTNIADNKARQMIRRMKRENEDSIIIVCGCSAENHQENLLPLGIDILIGNKDKSKLVSIVENFIKTKKPFVKFYNNKNLEFEDMSVSKFSNHTRAFIKIQDGCDNYCSYCIIPFMRGNIRFKDFNQCLKEAKTLVENNHKEIVLTGIHTGSYGRGSKHDLTDLINEMSKIKNLERIRISSIEITEITDKFLELLKTNPKICSHLHIPLQSGNDKILKLMNRKYNLDYYRQKIASIRKIRPNISITTDVIVGFPNENDEDFNLVYKFCKEIAFSKIHVFPYSKRSNTKASSMDNQIDEHTKKSRSKILNNLSNQLQINYNQKFIGSKFPVLIEEIKNGSSYGFTDNYIKVKINQELTRNTIYNIKLTMLEDINIIGKNLELKLEEKVSIIN